MTTRILIIEDERSIAEGIAFNLRQDGYEAILARSGEDGLALFRKEPADLVLLDLMLPGMDGLSVCRTLRRESTVPILMLTARGSEMDKVIGLEVGADDYITKPFSVSELLARIKAALRRARTTPAVRPMALITAGEITLDPETRAITVSDAPVELRPKEFELLRVLMGAPGKVFRREELFTQVWGEVEYLDRGTLDVHIRWLREKIEQDPSRPAHIITVRNVGYKFVA